MRQTEITDPVPSDTWLFSWFIQSNDAVPITCILTVFKNRMIIKITIFWDASAHSLLDRYKITRRRIHETVNQILNAMRTSYFMFFIHSSMALQPFFGHWPLLQFRNLLYTVGRTPWTSGQPVWDVMPCILVNIYQRFM
jgi:hypothetical protein